jgi:hypothetical protein
MIHFREIKDTDPALALSPIVRAIEKTFEYIGTHGSIGLTPSKAFKRVFLHWAAAEFEWPNYSEADLFRVNKVLNEIDFPPLMYVHDLLVDLRIGRHYKGAFHITKKGETLIGHPGKIFGTVTPFFLFEINHSTYARVQDQLLGNWEIFLNILNMEAEDGILGRELSEILYGEPDPAVGGVNVALHSLYSHVLRPLCWTGLLEEHFQNGRRVNDRVYTKTALWKASLQLDTDNQVKRAIRH